jgi:two-component system chemotaxis sensor kinase CheA
MIFFALLSLFLKKLIYREDISNNYKGDLKKVAFDLMELTRGRKIDLPPTQNAPSPSPSFPYSFTEKDEEAFDYSGLVSDGALLNTYTNEVEEFLDSAQSALLDLEHDRGCEEAINRVFRCFHTIKSSSAMLGYKNSEALSHHMENMLGKVRDKELLITPELIDIIFHGIGIIRDLMNMIKTSDNDRDRIIREFRTYSLTPYIQLVDRITQEFRNKKIGEILRDMGTLSDSTLQSLLAKQETANLMFGEMAMEEKAISEDDLKKALDEQTRQKAQKTQKNFIRVDSDKISSLVDMVGELVVNQSMIRQKILQGNHNLNEQDINQQEEVTSQIKDLVLTMGMVPLAEMFQRLRVVVRNTARELNKAIKFTTQGEDTEIDRSLVEAIYDPLVHMVRNSVSHGIETPDEREKAGKSAMGCVCITAEYRGNGVEISVRDDGRGIDPEKVVDKAIKMGLVEPHQKEASISDKPFVYSLLFKPGFSIKEKADSISGRGVGMDVVMQNISRINGKIEIQSTLGEGSTFRIKLPLTLAIIDGFVTQIEKEYYVFPFELIEEILVNREIEIIPMEGDSSMGKFRDKFFPLVDFYTLLTGKKREYIENFVYVLINYEDNELAIPVDRVLGKQEIVIKNLNELIRHQKLFYGGTVFGDGSIGFILDMEETVSQFKKTNNNLAVQNDLSNRGMEAQNEKEKP